MKALGYVFLAALVTAAGCGVPEDELEPVQAEEQLSSQEQGVTRRLTVGPDNVEILRFGCYDGSSPPQPRRNRHPPCIPSARSRCRAMGSPVVLAMKRGRTAVDAALSVVTFRPARGASGCRSTYSSSFTRSRCSSFRRPPSTKARCSIQQVPEVPLGRREV